MSQNGLGDSPYPDLVPVCDQRKGESVAVNVFPDPEYDPYLTGKSPRAPLTGAIHPMASSKATFINTAIDAARSLMARRLPRKIIITALTYSIILVYFSSLASELESMCLASFIFLNYFQFIALFCEIIHHWVAVSSPASPKYSFGYARFEVLSVFSLFIYALFTSLINIKEGLEHYLHYADARKLAHPHHPILLTTATVSFAIQIFITYGIENRALQHCTDHASPSFIQRELSLLKLNPLILMGLLSLLSVALADLLVLFGYPFQTADLIGAALISLIVFITVIPLAHYAGCILLQATPDDLQIKLDTIRSELTTMEGVLEVKNEHFWSTGFTQTAGSIQVRVSRNSNEQKVLAMIVLKLFPIVPKCSIQVTKDDWSVANSKKPLNFTISAKQIESLKELSIPAFGLKPANQSEIVTQQKAMNQQKAKLSSIIKQKAQQKSSVNRLGAYSSLKQS